MEGTDSYARKLEILRLQQEISDLENGDNNEYDVSELQERQAYDDEDDEEEDDDDVRRLEREIEELERDISITDERMSQLSFSVDPSTLSSPPRDSMDYSNYLHNPLKANSTNQSNRHRHHSPSPDATRGSVNTNAMSNRKNRVASAVYSSAHSSPARHTTSNSGSNKPNSPPPPPPPAASNTAPPQQASSSSSGGRFSFMGKKSQVEKEDAFNSSVSSGAGKYSPPRSGQGYAGSSGSSSSSSGRPDSGTNSSGSSGSSGQRSPQPSSSSSSQHFSQSTSRPHSSTVSGMTRSQQQSHPHHTSSSRSQSQSQSQSSDSHSHSHTRQRSSTTAGSGTGSTRRLVASANTSYARRSEAVSASGKTTHVTVQKSAPRKNSFFASASRGRLSMSGRDSSSNIATASLTRGGTTEHTLCNGCGERCNGCGERCNGCGERCNGGGGTTLCSG